MLSIEDYKILLSIIDVSAQKGLFRAMDFVPVGNLYSKIQGIIQVSEQQDE